MIHEREKICPRCDAQKMKSWAELSDEQKMLVERLPFPRNLLYPKEKSTAFARGAGLKTLAAKKPSLDPPNHGVTGTSRSITTIFSSRVTIPITT